MIQKHMQAPHSADRVLIEGGNHRQHADYSFQRDDGIATITAEEQQNQIIAATIQFSTLWNSQFVN
ncbi:hypothetical protein [Candidatus Leptofilum sp.]|uniref:hypothetical protein n=1 Tax=Candidatus Leptofilum sp. TaxID=3241576 RepID=UPI003B5BD00C